MFQIVLKKVRFMLLLIIMLTGIIMIAGCASDSEDTGLGYDPPIQNQEPTEEPPDNPTPKNEQDEYPDLSDQNMLIELLYTVYAGIGYMDVSSEVDNEQFYNLMVEDINTAFGRILLKLLKNSDFSDIDIFLPGSYTKTHTYIRNNTTLYTSAFNFIIDISEGDASLISFEGTLSIDFKNTGFRIHDHTYYGENGNYDLVANIAGEVDPSTLSDNFDPITFFTQHIGSIVITANNGLEAIYQLCEESFNVFYGTNNDPWEIAYSADSTHNQYLLPFPDIRNQLIEEDVIADHRDYTIGGSFTVSDRTYTFNNNFRYSQIILSKIENLEVFLDIFENSIFQGIELSEYFLERFGTVTIMEGSVKIPGVSEFITIIPPISIPEIDDVISLKLMMAAICEQKIIRRDFSINPLFPSLGETPVGIWADGELIFGIENDWEQVTATFSFTDEKSTATFNKGSKDEWSVDEWQNTNDIFKKIAPGILDCRNSDIDTDGDDMPDYLDECPTDSEKTEEGDCGCGTSDSDSDGDGAADCNDDCPNSAIKTQPGICGCNIPDIDIDGDGTVDCDENCDYSIDTDGDSEPDCTDDCPDDPNKIVEGICGCGIPDTDSDGDDIMDCNDGCPSDPNKIEEGICGCGTADKDSDGDGTFDCNDGCPIDPNKIEAGVCGCGALDTDSDSDGTLNCIDGCPNDPNKIEEGICGCGMADTDSDSDGTIDCIDGCPNDPNKIEEGICGCGAADTDSDSDGTIDCIDACPNDPNKNEEGICGCGAADTDSDSDGTPDCIDACPNDTDKTAPGICGCGTADTDSDTDGTPDCIDACPNDTDKTAPGICGCGTADTDSDTDGTPDCIDACPGDPDKIAEGICGCGTADTDSDSDDTPDCIDACPDDPDKIEEGVCGCGKADTDSDSDGTPDCIDECPIDPDKIEEGVCGCGIPDTDSDGDGIMDCNEVTAHIEITHPRNRELTVTIGVGDPDAPTWLKTIWQGNDEMPIEEDVLLDVDVTEEIAYMPPSESNAWFLKVYNRGSYTGEITSFTITHGSEEYVSGDTPVLLLTPQSSGYAYIPQAPEDYTPPSPNPAAFSSVPDDSYTLLTGWRVTMTAMTAYDRNDVEYYFEETTGHAGGSDSGWQDSPTYTDSGVWYLQTYTYRVRVRDKSSNQNLTEWSNTYSITIY